MQTRLAKYKDQLLEVKTNREYTAMLHEIETAQNDIRTREDRILEIMMETDELNAGIKKSEAELKTAEKEIAAERAVLDAETAGLQAEIDKSDRGARKRSSREIDRHVLAFSKRLPRDGKASPSRRRKTGCARSVMCACARRCSTKFAKTSRSSSATVVAGFSISRATPKPRRPSPRS